MGNTGLNQQPINYNHKLHMEDAGLNCIDCHTNVEIQSRASIPNIQMCGECHDDPEVENEELRKLANFVLNETEISWIQVHLVPDHAYFSHRRHVKLGQIECSVCHGEVAQKETPFLEAHVTMEMSWCMDCHKQRAVSNECDTCHR